MLAHPDFETKKKLAAYYTPAELSQILTDFAISSHQDMVLEPSFGGGAFLRAALGRLKALGAASPAKQIFGCDIDHNAFDSLSSYTNNRMAKPGRRFVKCDFLDVKAGDFLSSSFDCIIGNPPYIGYKKIDQATRDKTSEIAKHWGLSRFRYASLWYFFVLKSLMLLKPGGRIAFVLPQAFIDNDYAEPLRKFLSINFGSMETYAIPKNLFLDQGTKEKVVVLAAVGWQMENRRAVRKAIQVSSFDELSQLLSQQINQNSLTRHHLKCTAGRMEGALTNSEVSLVNEISQHSQCIELGALMDVKIGAVTGDVNYFLFNQSKIDSAGLDERIHFTPIIRSLKDFKGLAYSNKDWSLAHEVDSECYMLRYSEEFLKNRYYHKYICQYDSVAIEANSTFKNRDVWCDIPTGEVPDLFLPYMSTFSPRAIINFKQAQCTNNTHRGYFVNSIKPHLKKLVAISLTSSFTALIAELEAKTYGNGMLKMEPGFYRRLKLLYPTQVKIADVNQCYRKLDRLLRMNDRLAATKLATDFIFTRCFSSAKAATIGKATAKTYTKLESLRLQQ